IAHGVPLVTSRQMLTWIDGRNGSAFGGISWNANALSFTISVGAGANGLTGMVPTLGPNGTTLSGLTRAGSPVSFTTVTIKGVQYAMFLAAPGAYAATYSGGGGFAPAVTSATVQAAAQSATLEIASTTATRTEIRYGTSPTTLNKRLVDGSQGT